jgi:uncharacterized protein DUF3261
VRALLLAGLAVAGCAAPQLWGPPRLAECAGPIASAAEIPGGDFRRRERVRIDGDDVDLGLELLAERRGDRLVLVAFNSFGARVFSVVQQGSEIDSDAPFAAGLQIPPANLLRDLHAARFQRAETSERVQVTRPGCDYTVTFVLVERLDL